jgi:hypothetical protein
MTMAALAVPFAATLAPRTAHAEETTAPASAAAPLASGPPVAAAGVAPAPVVAAPAPSPSAPAPASLVELAADDSRATIERRVGTTTPSGMPLFETGLFAVGQWEHACVAPCAMKLDPRYAYRVAGDGLVPTESFALPRGDGRVRVDAKMGSSTGRVAGALTTGAGVAALALGGLALVATPILHSEDVGSQGFRTGVLAGGVGAVSVGVIAVGVGTLLWLTNGSSARTVASR